VVIALGECLISIDFILASLALPTITQTLQLDAAAAQWVISAYSLAFGGFLILGGRLSDLIGSKRCYMVGVGLVTLGAALSGFAASLGQLIIARTLQGIGAAFLLPSALSLLVQAFPDQERRLRAITAITAAQIVASILGMIAAGILIAALGTHGAFLVNLPLGICTLFAAPYLLPPRVAKKHRQPPIALGSALLITAASALLVRSVSTLSLRNGGHQSTLWMAIAAFGLFSAFLLRQRSTPYPLVSATVFRSPDFVVGVLLQAVIAAAGAAMISLASMSLQRSQHYSPLQVGLGLIPYGTVSLFMMWLVRRLGSRILVRPRSAVVCSLICMAGAYLLLSRPFSPNSFAINFLPALTLLPIGLALGLGVTIGRALGGVPAEYQGVASAVLYMVRMITIAIVIALMLAVSVPADPGLSEMALRTPYKHGYEVGFALCLAGMLAACAMRPLLPGQAALKTVTP
jgi:MFS family permease